MFIHGIDEAGYGPLLGPLVLGRADFEVDERQELSHRHRDLAPVGDSKQLLGRRGGLARLEAVVLGVYACLYGSPPSLVRDWFALDASWPPSDAGNLLPWYADLEVSLPLWATGDELAASWDVLEKGAVFRGGELRGLALRITDEESLNTLWQRSGNKHDTHFLQVVSLAEEVLQGGRQRWVQIDRLGGRRRYEEKLTCVFPFVPIQVVQEEQRDAHYRVTPEDIPFDLSFHVKGDQRFTAIALASMLAKYTREVCMFLFNDYWCSRHEGLSPTAGYYQDGRRFLNDLDALGEGDSRLRQRMMRQR